MRSLDLLLTVLEEPERVGPIEADGCLVDLVSSSAQARQLGIGALAAVGYARPELMGARHLDALFSPPVSGDERVEAVLEGLIATDSGPRIGERLAADSTGQGLLPPGSRRRLLGHVVRWWPAAIPLSALATIVGGVHAPEERSRWLTEVLEPALDRRPAEITPALVDRLVDWLESTPRCRHTLHRISERLEAPESTRHAARAACAGRFAIREEARKLFSRPGFHVLFIQALRLGQGDEILRIGPLLNGLLSTHPELRATVLTPRPYLYDHPRVHAVDVSDEATARAVLGAQWDGLVALQEPRVPEARLAPSVFEELELRAEIPRRFLFLATTVQNHLVCRRLAFGGREIPDRLGLHRLDALDAYDTSRRLLAELGLPDVLAGTSGEPRTNCFTSRPSEDAQIAWRVLRGGEGRRVALVWPFGGASEEKGFPRDRIAELAAEVRALVEGGWRVLVLPAGTEWASREVLGDVLDALPEPARNHVALGPDPGGTASDPGALILRERPDLPYADRVMRLFRYFATFADRVVTVEGWLGHLAAAVGAPLRLVLMAGSYSYDWYPPGAVELASRLSPSADSLAGDRIAADARPPLPRRYPGTLLCTALAGLAGSEDPRGRSILARSLESLDSRLRTTAAGALRFHGHDPEIARKLLQRLDDPDHRVRAAAASSLVRIQAAVAPEVRSPSRSTLEAHRAIAEQEWLRVMTLGEPAMPALAAAVRGNDATIAREARRMMARLMKDRLPARPGGD